MHACVSVQSILCTFSSVCTALFSLYKSSCIDLTQLQKHYTMYAGDQGVGVAGCLLSSYLTYNRLSEYWLLFSTLTYHALHTYGLSLS